MKPSRTNHIVLVLAVAAAALFSPGALHDASAWITDVDTGVISAMTDDTVYMHGEKGEHVFELMGMCSWCEEGADVAAVFEGLLHVTLSPYPNTFGKPAVRGLIVKDGREEF